MAYRSLMDLMNTDAMQNAQIYNVGQEAQARNMQMQHVQQDFQDKAALRDLMQSQFKQAGGDVGKLSELMLSNPLTMGQGLQLKQAMTKDIGWQDAGDKLVQMSGGQPTGVTIPKAAAPKLQERWSDPYNLGGATVIKNLDTGEIKTAVSRPPITAIYGDAGKPPAGYRYTKTGDLEAIPGGPADAKAQANAQRLAAGAQDVDVALSTLRDAYTRLEKGGGITSTGNKWGTNLGASISSSGMGQAVGKMLGTQNQSARNDIAMARPALLAALMKATGMSAKQMDSNAELKLWLSTATDPSLDVEANRRALDNIERKYLNGAKVQTGNTNSAPTNPNYSGFSIVP